MKETKKRKEYKGKEREKNKTKQKVWEGKAKFVKQLETVQMTAAVVAQNILRVL